MHRYRSAMRQDDFSGGCVVMGKPAAAPWDVRPDPATLQALAANPVAAGLAKQAQQYGLHAMSDDTLVALDQQLGAYGASPPAYEHQHGGSVDAARLRQMLQQQQQQQAVSPVGARAGALPGHSGASPMPAKQEQMLGGAASGWSLGAVSGVEVGNELLLSQLQQQQQPGGMDASSIDAQLLQQLVAAASGSPSACGADALGMQQQHDFSNSAAFSQACDMQQQLMLQQLQLQALASQPPASAAPAGPPALGSVQGLLQNLQLQQQQLNALAMAMAGSPPGLAQAPAVPVQAAGAAALLPQQMLHNPAAAAAAAAAAAGGSAWLSQGLPDASSQGAMAAAMMAAAATAAAAAVQQQAAAAAAVPGLFSAGLLPLSMQNQLAAQLLAGQAALAPLSPMCQLPGGRMAGSPLAPASGCGSPQSGGRRRGSGRSGRGSNGAMCPPVEVLTGGSRRSSGCEPSPAVDLAAAAGLAGVQLEELCPSRYEEFWGAAAGADEASKGSSSSGASSGGDLHRSSDASVLSAASSSSGGSDASSIERCESLASSGSVASDLGEHDAAAALPEPAAAKAAAGDGSSGSSGGGPAVWFPGAREASGDDAWYLPRPATSRLFVGNIGCWVDEATLLSYFGKYGTVVDVQVMWNTKMLARGRRVNREFAFISYASPLEAARAVHWLDGCRLADLEKDKNGVTVEYENGDGDAAAATGCGGMAAAMAGRC